MMELLLPKYYQLITFNYRYRFVSSPRLKSPNLRKWPMVNPLDIMPVLALAFAIMCIPILGDRP